jgi:hypothetical protein
MLIDSVWRPLKYTVEDYPLAVCDGSSFDEATVVIVDHIRRGYIGETVFPLYSASNRWHYLRNQSKDEVILFKMFDTREKVAARCENRVPKKPTATDLLRLSAHVISTEECSHSSNAAREH